MERKNRIGRKDIEISWVERTIIKRAWWSTRHNILGVWLDRRLDGKNRGKLIEVWPDEISIGTVSYIFIGSGEDIDLWGKSNSGPKREFLWESYTRRNGSAIDCNSLRGIPSEVLTYASK